MKRLLLFSLLAAATLSACSTYGPPYGPPPQVVPPPETPFRAEDFTWSQAPGAAGVRGAVAFQAAAGPYTCAGASVALIPDTAYSRGRIIRLYGVADRAAVPVSVVRARQEGRAGEAYAAFVRTARCGAEGSFSFERLPPGSWFLVASAKPLAGKGDTMVLLRRVRTRPGQQLQLVLQ
ncbi:MAG TPA: hypothetical protein VF559_00465 [Caulobacteraceae bacterium]|jgi:predicted small lipoprotein YifL